MPDSYVYLQWVKSYLRGLMAPLKVDDQEEPWVKGATWAIEKVEDHLEVILHCINLYSSEGTFMDLGNDPNLPEVIREKCQK